MTLHRQLAGAAVLTAALYGSFSRHGAVILVTNLSRIGQKLAAQP